MRLSDATTKEFFHEEILENGYVQILCDTDRPTSLSAAFKKVGLDAEYDGCTEILVVLTEPGHYEAMVKAVANRFNAVVDNDGIVTYVLGNYCAAGLMHVYDIDRIMYSKLLYAHTFLDLPTLKHAVRQYEKEERVDFKADQVKAAMLRAYYNAAGEFISRAMADNIHGAHETLRWVSNDLQEAVNAVLAD